jgi:hypothetical protein
LLLERLRQIGWVAPTGREAWILARSSEAITLAQVYSQFVFSAQADMHSAENEFEKHVVMLAGAPIEDMTMSLKTLFAERELRDAGIDPVRART